MRRFSLDSRRVLRALFWLGLCLGGCDTVGTIESVKAVADLYLPISGEIVEVNQDVVDSPELVNKDPMDGGWLLKVKLSDPGELDQLLDAAGYSELTGG